MRVSLLALSILALATPAFAQELWPEAPYRAPLEEEAPQERIVLNLEDGWSLESDERAFVRRFEGFELQVGHEEIERRYQMRHVSTYEDDYYGFVLMRRF